LVLTSTKACCTRILRIVQGVMTSTSAIPPITLRRAALRQPSARHHHSASSGSTRTIIVLVSAPNPKHTPSATAQRQPRVSRTR
jgi:hypothetical protein